MRETRQCQAFAEVDICDICGRIEVTGVKIGRAEFDPRSRAQGFARAAVWQAHPHYHHDVCTTCLRNRKHVVEGHPMLVEGAVRAQEWEHIEMARVSSRPAEEGWWDGHTAYALLFGRSERALLLARTSSYLRPLLAGDALAYEVSTKLVDEETPLLLCEVSDATPWPTFYRLSDPNYLDVQSVRTRYGSECASRMLQYDGEYFEALEVKLTPATERKS